MRPMRPPRLSFSWMAAAAVGVSIFAMLPLGFIVWIGIQSGWETVAALVFRPRVANLLGNSILLVMCTVPLCAVLALALAWLTERSLLPAARWWSWLMIAPLAVPAFVQSYAWITILPGLKGLSGAVLVSVLAYFPFMYLPISSALRQLDPSLEDVAASLGYSRLQVWFRVVLPQLRLALCGGGLLVGLHLLAEYGLFVMIRFDTFTTAIVDQFQSSYNGPAANMLGGVLALCCLGLLALDNFLRGGARYARVGSGAARLAREDATGRRRLRRIMLALSLCLLPLCTALLALGVPLSTLGRWLVAGGSAVWRPDELLPAAFQTFYLAFGGALLTTIVALPMAWLSVRAPGRLQRILEGSNYIVGALPGVVIALCLVTLTVRLPIYQTGLTAMLAYMLLFLPRALLSLRTGISQAPVELEQVARSLGRTPANAIWTVTMRIAAPNAAAGAALVLLGITNELTATLMLAPNGTQTLAMMFWSYSSEIDYAAAAPYALIMVLLSLPMTWLLYIQSKWSAGR